MSFAAGAGAYDRFMGRYSAPLARPFAELADVARGQRVLDVGCGPGALTAELARVAGPTEVTAVDPTPGFVEAARERNPGVDVQHASAESLPFADGAFDAALAQLVVHFMHDPVAGLREMRRVTRAGGTVAACVWDHAGGSGPLALFWQAARALDPAVEDESRLPGSREGDLTRLFEGAGLRDVEETLLTVEVEHSSFDEWWEPFTLGVGPAGAYVAALEPDAREPLRDHCRALLSPGPFTVRAGAWSARGAA